LRNWVTYWEHNWEAIENLWEHQNKNTKQPTNLPPKEKTFWMCMLSPKLLCHHFWPRLIALPMYMGTYLLPKYGCIWNLMGAPLGTCWEHIGNQKKKRKSNPLLRRKKTMNLLGACNITWLVEHNFYSYICLPPFGIFDLG
jgi:hypothetical protein